MTQALWAAEQAERTKQSEIDSLSEQLSGLQSKEVKPDLRAVLAKARSFGDPETSIQKQQVALSKAKTAFESLLVELGQWSKDLPDLKGHATPQPGKNIAFGATSASSCY